MERPSTQMEWWNGGDQVIVSNGIRLSFKNLSCISLYAFLTTGVVVLSVPFLFLLVYGISMGMGGNEEWGKQAISGWF